MISEDWHHAPFDEVAPVAWGIHSYLRQLQSFLRQEKQLSDLYFRRQLFSKVIS
jgi:hypothetical protein